MTIQGPGTVRVGQATNYQIETKDKDKTPKEIE